MNETEFIRIQKTLMKWVAELAKEEKRSKTNMTNILVTEALQQRKNQKVQDTYDKLRKSLGGDV